MSELLQKLDPNYKPPSEEETVAKAKETGRLQRTLMEDSGMVFEAVPMIELTVTELREACAMQPTNEHAIVFVNGVKRFDGGQKVSVRRDQVIELVGKEHELLKSKDDEPPTPVELKTAAKKREPKPKKPREPRG